MTVVESQLSVWEALAGRAPGRPVGPADPGVWAAVAERLNPVKGVSPAARRDRGVASGQRARRAVRDAAVPRPRRGCYLRLTPEEVRLAHLMDGTLTVARLVAEFARICGLLAPDQVVRVVADLAGNRMLEDLPVDAGWFGEPRCALLSSGGRTGIPRMFVGNPPRWASVRR